MSLAELLYSRLSPKFTLSSSSSPPSSSSPSSSPVPGHKYQYQQLRHAQDTSQKNIKPSYQNESPLRFIRYPFNVWNNIVGYKKTIFDSVEQSVPQVINELIDIKTNKLNAIQTHLPIPQRKPEHISLHFEPSFQDNFRQGEELDKTNNKQVENTKIQSPEKLQVPAEKTPIDIALAPSKIFLGKNQPGTTSKC